MAFFNVRQNNFAHYHMKNFHLITQKTKQAFLIVNIKVQFNQAIKMSRVALECDENYPEYFFFQNNVINALF